MARDRLSVILDGMALKKDLKAAHYKVYLSLFSALRKGFCHNKQSLRLATGLSLRSFQRGLSDLIKTGNVALSPSKAVFLTFITGLINNETVEKIDKSSAKSNVLSKFIYFIKSGKYIKIGISSNVFHRLNSLQSASPTKLSVLGIIKDSTHKTEKEIQDKFKSLRVEGEWFVYGKSLKKYIEELSESGKMVALERAKLVASDAESQSIYLREDIRNKIYELSNMIHISYNEVLSSLKLRAISSISDSKSRMRVDPRFQELVDRLFKTFEKVFKEKMNPLWGKSDGAMVKRMLLSLPEEGVDRLVSSFENFLHTTDPFEIEQVKNKPVRYWATRVTKYLPAKQFDVVAAAKAQQRRNREKKNV